MQVIEQHIIGKRGAELCEDTLLVTDSFAAVVDGSTSKSTLPPLDSRLSHGQIAAECVCRYVRTCPKDIDMPTFCEGVTTALRKQYPIHRPTLTWQHLAQHPEDRFTCSAIVYSAYRQQIWMIGDCHCLLLDKKTHATHYYDNPKPMEDILAAKRSEKILQMLAAGCSIADIRNNDEGRASIIPQLKASMKAQNHDYAVIDGFGIPINKVKVINTQDIEEIILASDGYPHLFPTLDATELHLRTLLANDPLLIHDYKATKGWYPGSNSFDDRCYLRFR